MFIKIPMLKEEVEIFIESAQKKTGGGFSFRYDEEEQAMFIKNAEGVDENWKSLPEYTFVKSRRKIKELFEKEDKKAKAAKYKEVKKDESLTPEEIVMIDEIIAELEQ